MKNNKFIPIITTLVLLSSCGGRSSKKYTITFTDSDGTILQVLKNVKEGTTPTYTGVKPSKEMDAQYEYSFNKWKPNLHSAYSDETYVALYTETIRQYDVTWLNEDAVIAVDKYNYGAVPTYNHDIPLKESDETYTYEFTGWQEEFTEVRGDTAYNATFEYDSIKFGSYPQTKVTDTSLSLQLLDKISEKGGTPSATDKKQWTLFPYFFLNEGDSAYAWYMDIAYNNENYRAIYLTDGRYSFEDDKSNRYNCKNYSYSNVHFFKYEPITWFVSERNDNEVGLVSSFIIDVMHFNNTGKRVVDYNNVLNANYEYSFIRKWINEDLYNLAFSSQEKQQIINHLIDNSYASGNYFPCNDTYDNVTLITSKEYSRFYDPNTRSRRDPGSLGSDYSFAIGLLNSEYNGFENAGYFYTRSSEYASPTCGRVDCNMYVGDSSSSANSYGDEIAGVRPMIWIKK